MTRTRLPRRKAPSFGVRSRLNNELDRDRTFRRIVRSLDLLKGLGRVKEMRHRFLLTSVARSVSRSRPYVLHSGLLVLDDP